MLNKDNKCVVFFALSSSSTHTIWWCVYVDNTVVNENLVDVRNFSKAETLIEGL